MQDVWTNIHCVLSYSLLVDVCICFFTASARCSPNLMQQKAREPAVSLGADTVSRAYRGSEVMRIAFIILVFRKGYEQVRSFAYWRCSTGES